jgi:hypothetical protein
MKASSVSLAIVAAVLGLLAAEPLFASDTYREQQPRFDRLGEFPQKTPEELEAERRHRVYYRAGQLVYDRGGSGTPGQAAQVEAQRARLQALQNTLPEKVAKKKDLVAYAGTLTADQLALLEYFVTHRYPPKKKKK